MGMRIIMVISSLLSVCMAGCTTTRTPLPPNFDYCGYTVTLTDFYKRPVVTVDSDDRKIIANIVCRNLTGGHSIRWDWYSPDGKLYVSKSTDIHTTDGTFSKQVDAWHALNIKGDKAESLPGRWRVKVFVDHKLVDAPFFTLSRSNSVSDAAPEPETKPQRSFSKEYKPPE